MNVVRGNDCFCENKNEHLNWVCKQSTDIFVLNLEVYINYDLKGVM